MAEAADDPCVKKEVVEVEVEKPFVYKWGTCPWDPRFPQTNQTKYCYVSFIDYQRCIRLLGDDEGCNYFKRCYQSMCPNAWIEKWQGQLEDGTFPRCLYPPNSP